MNQSLFFHVILPNCLDLIAKLRMISRNKHLVDGNANSVNGSTFSLQTKTNHVVHLTRSWFLECISLYIDCMTSCQLYVIVWCFDITSIYAATISDIKFFLVLESQSQNFRWIKLVIAPDTDLERSFQVPDQFLQKVTRHFYYLPETRLRHLLRWQPLKKVVFLWIMCNY